MSINKHTSIYKKYIQARDAFSSETSKLLTNISGGHKTKKKITMYNTIAAWLDFIGQEVPSPISINQTAPTNVTFKVIAKDLESLSNQYPEDFTVRVNLFLEDSKGIRRKLATVPYIEGAVSNIAISADIQNTLYAEGYASMTSFFNSSTNQLTLVFPPGAKYNGGKVKVSETASLEPAVVTIMGGSDHFVSNTNLSDEEIEKVDDLLDRIAIELGLIYSDKKYEDITSKDVVQKDISHLRTPQNLSLTAEDGSPLEV